VEKATAVASLGQYSMLLPALINSALQANDRLKLYLSVLQSAAQHAARPEAALVDWSREISHLGLRDASWLKDIAASAYQQDQMLMVPELGLWLDALALDLKTMARPLCEVTDHCDSQLLARRNAWLQRIEELKDEEGLSPQALNELTHGDRHLSDSLHLLVMDLHKQLNAMAVTVATEEVDGAHAWQIADEDRPRIRAFMRGLARTAPLKFHHPGLDTAVTRSGERLLIQNDIGTNDAHVLVMEVEALTIRLTYSDLHASRFAFFTQMLQTYGFQWTVFEPRTTEGLNQGKPYHVGHAALTAPDEESLQNALGFAASRIVFVIDWNRARKRLQKFVSKPVALELLAQAAGQEFGHMAWLLAGGEALVYEAMQAVDGEAFRIGDRLDQVLGEATTRQFLLDLLRVSSVKLREQQPVALIADEARLLLSRALRRRTFEYDLLAEHAAYCHALASGLADAIDTGEASDEQVMRAKNWERKADHLLMEARRRAERQARWQPIVQLLDQMDDIADALEEALFIQRMLHLPPFKGLPTGVRTVVSELARHTLVAMQDQVKAIEVARHLSEQAEAADTEAFLQALWRMLRAERICDDLMRDARLQILQHLHDHPAGFTLATELASTIEQATDRLLSAGYILRRLVFNKTGLSA